jgi:hypothetical protein
MAADSRAPAAERATSRPTSEKNVRIGVGFLAYNEEDLIAKTVEEAVTSLSAIPGLSWHVVVVNDGGDDVEGLVAIDEPSHGYPHAMTLTVPPLGFLLLKPEKA